MRRNSLTLFLTVVVVIILVLQWLPVIQASWSIRDDYDFVAAMNDHGRLSFHDFFQRMSPQGLALGTEVNRPVYEIVHDSWMLLIGNNLPLWQSAKIVTFGIVIALFFWFFASATDLVAAIVLTCFVGFQPAWADVVPRANSELFAVLGLVIYAIGNLYLLRTPTDSVLGSGKKSSRMHLLLVAFGGTIAVASKENFCFTILASSACLLLFSWLLEKKPLLAVAQLVPLLMALIFCGLIVYGMKANGGKALYGQTFEPLTIFVTGLTRCLTGGIISWIPACLGVLYGVVFLVRRNQTHLWMTLYEGGLLGIVFLNFGFYTGLPLFGRYFIPENFVPAFAVLPLLAEIRLRGRRVQFVSYGLLVALCLPVAIAGFLFNYKWSVDYRDETERFAAKLRKVMEVVSKDPHKPLVFESYAVSDYEPLISVQTYLNYYGASNPEFVKINYSESELKDPHEVYIYSLVRDLVSPEGQFKPVSALSSSDHFTITFSSPQPQAQAITNFNGQE
jgi:hypothetical protein